LSLKKKSSYSKIIVLKYRENNCFINTEKEF